LGTLQAARRRNRQSNKNPWLGATRGPKQARSVKRSTAVSLNHSHRVSYKARNPRFLRVTFRSLPLAARLFASLYASRCRLRRAVSPKACSVPNSRQRQKLGNSRSLASSAALLPSGRRKTRSPHREHCPTILPLHWLAISVVSLTNGCQRNRMNPIGTSGRSAQRFLFHRF
jgi:hypothetical protein